MNSLTSSMNLLEYLNIIYVIRHICRKNLYSYSLDRFTKHGLPRSSQCLRYPSGELGSCRASKQLISRRLQMQNRLNQMLHDTQLGYLNSWNWCKRKMLISAAHKILMLGWFGFMEMRLLEGAPLLRLLFTYVRFKFSRLKLLGDGFREALDIWKKPMYFMDFIMGFVAHYDMMGWHRLTSCWKPQGWGRIYKQPNTQSFEHDSLTCIKCQIHWGDWAVFSAQIW